MKPTILLVDDHEIVRKGIRKLLEGPTREICAEAASGEEAISKALELKPDLIITDYFMRGMGGLELIRRLRELLPTMKVIVLTMDDTVTNEALKAGADACVFKGDLVATLNHIINRVLSRQQDGQILAHPASASPADPAHIRRVSELAYRYWQLRGSPDGSPEVDWYRAEREIEKESGAWGPLRFHKE